MYYNIMQIKCKTKLNPNKFIKAFVINTHTQFKSMLDPNNV